MALASFDINILAVIVSAIVYFVLGMIWYSQKVFGKQWISLMELSEAQMNEMKRKGMAKQMITAIISGFVTALILAYVIGMSGATVISEGLLVGFLVWLGFIATLSLGSILWEGKNFKFYAINVGYQLVSFLIMSLILTVWI